MTPVKRALVLVATSCATALLLTGCGGSVSIGEKTVSKADVETQAAKQLAAEVNQPEPKITCPGDLKAEVDATLECTLVAAGATTEYPVTIKVTSVEDGTAKFAIEVGQAPVE